MSKSGTRPVRLALAALALVVVGALGVSASAFGRSSAKSCGTVTLDENAWAGATANVYVVKYVLEKNLGCTVNIEKLPESTPLFQAMADGKVDVVPEDWNNIDLKVNKKYLSSGSILRLGSNGVIGHIGTIFGDHQISIQSIVQRGTAYTGAQIVIVTHAVKNSDMEKAVDELKKREFLKEVSSCFRIYEAARNGG